MSARNFHDLNRAMGQLRRCIDALHRTHGGGAAVGRLVNSFERLELDAAELSTLDRARSRAHNVVYINDEPYDPVIWHGADEEGVGGHRRHGHHHAEL
ncbi:hypothetical protein [Kutzneria sp. CA-103260]|uniref:hypothetical protein n=1 Tax=Kutzneria sp. CA-103260 TaxID=2802641 RepID=UPI001BEEFC09|nr:hypothetical protein [Kutzneria sp. CA-103260]QUQ72373.1 hypothetical protein JJ691_101620 [Kutzneria sp. CA-103260]